MAPPLRMHGGSMIRPTRLGNTTGA